MLSLHFYRSTDTVGSCFSLLTQRSRKGFGSSVRVQPDGDCTWQAVGVGDSMTRSVVRKRGGGEEREGVAGGRIPRIDLDSLSSWMQTCWGCTPFSSLSGSGMLARALASGERPFMLGAGASSIGAVISLVSSRCKETRSHLHTCNVPC